MRPKLLSILSVALGTLSATPSSGFAQWTLRAEPNHSTVGFVVPIAGGITKVRGTFNEYDVSIRYDDKKLTSSTVEVTLKAGSVDTNNDMRNTDLRGAKFFDVEHHPLITFESQRIEPRGSGYVAVGPLTMNGITKIIELPFVITGRDAVDGRPIIGISATTTVNRRDFDIGTDWRHTAIPNFLGDIVTIEIDLVTRPGTPIDATSGTQ